MIATIDLHFLQNEHAIGAYLIKTTEGPVLVECGPYSTWQALKAGLAAHAVAPEEIKHVFLTHIHFDHAGAAWALARTGAIIHVHPKGAVHLSQPERLYNSARMIYGNLMDSLWGAMETIDPELIQQPEHFETVQIGDTCFTALYTPGHAVHHIAWQVSAPGEPNVIFTGDIAGVRINSGPVVPPCPPPDINLEDWRESIALLRSRGAQALYLTHYGKITDVDSHLDRLELELNAWAEWIYPYFVAQTDQKEIIPKFEAFVEARLRAQGVSDTVLAGYSAANPAYMSVAGLMRYWFKKQQADSAQPKT